MKLGFTGTRRGMTTPQMREFTLLIDRLQPSQFHRGDCVGADADAHVIVGLRCAACEINIHPPVDETHRAFMQRGVMHPAKTHFARNRDIVRACDALVATPCEMRRQDHGGTWYTVGFAEKHNKPVTIIWPNGKQLIIPVARAVGGEAR